MKHRRRLPQLVCSIGFAIAGLGLMAVAAPPVSHDFNADGSNDYPVSVTGYDPVSPVNGAARIWSGATKAIIDTIVGSDANTLFGWSIGSAGDLDGDGFDDLIVGEPLWGPNGSLQGRVRVFSGQDSSVLLTATGPFLETGLGRYVAGIGDWNGDGVPDIVSSGWDIADLNADGVGDDPVGIVFVLSGVDGSVLAEIFEPTGTELFGYSVFGLGDITGDGLADIAVVDRGAEGVPASGATGTLYIFTGRAQTGSLSVTDAHRTILNDDPTLRGFAAHVDTMHPDLWLDEAVLQIISLTTNEVGGPNEAETAIAIRKANGQVVGTKGVRPTLVLAGDVNLDGKVNALDLQASIAQLGTNPQAIGVMPLADLNADNIVDTHDVVLLLQDYGGETDIYEGLWDGSRLLFTVGANAGFGDLGGIGGIGGPISGEFGPGRRPIDNCLRDIPANNGPSLLPWLLRQDARANCGGGNCPPGCMVCEDNGSLSGGSVTANPPQPLVGQPFTFTASGVNDSGGSKKCDCGEGSAQVPAVTPTYAWCLVQRNQDGSWPDPPPSGAPCWKGGETTDPILGTACAEYRAYFQAFASRDCAPDPIIISGDANVADFQLEIICQADWLPTDRTRIGIGESVKIKANSGPNNPVMVAWQIITNGNYQPWTAGYELDFTAPMVEPEQTTSITINALSASSCLRTITFTVVPPKDVRFTYRPGLDYHVASIASAGMGLCVTILPEDVSFTGLIVGEGSCQPTKQTGVFTQFPNNYPHPAWPDDVLVESHNKIPANFDFPHFAIHPLPIFGYDVNSEFEWPIPWIYRINPSDTPRQFKVSNQYHYVSRTGDATITKGGITKTKRLNEDSTNANPGTGAYSPPPQSLTTCNN